ncbi:MAG: repressor LexA [bacterium]|nr:MAG: repressor LexA [bacterium]
MHELTPRQQQVLAYIRTFLSENGYPPTVRELAHHLNLSGPRAAAKHLEALERKGLIRRIPGISRGLEILSRFPSPLDGPGGVPVPVVGSVAAGALDLAAEEVEDYIHLDENLAGQDHFLLRVKGNSMRGEQILPGDLALVRPQATVYDGDIVVAVVGDEATLKRFRRTRDGIALEAANPEFPAIVLTGEDAGTTRIAGRVEAVIRILKGGNAR